MSPALRGEGFVNEIVHDQDGNPIDSTIPDGLRRLCVDAFLSGGTIPIVVTPTPNEANWITVALSPAPGVPAQLPNVAIPDGFALVVKNRSTNPVGTILFLATSVLQLGSATTRTELLVGESLSLFVVDMNVVFFQLNTVAFVEAYAEN